VQLRATLAYKYLLVLHLHRRSNQGSDAHSSSVAGLTFSKKGQSPQNPTIHSWQRAICNFFILNLLDSIHTCSHPSNIEKRFSAKISSSELSLLRATSGICTTCFWHI